LTVAHVTMKELVPLPAATVAIVRDARGGIEVLLLQRNLSSGFVAGVHLFPGGALDEADGAPEALAVCRGLDDLAASRILGLSSGGLAYWVAAIRESFEEAGILLACNARGELVSLADKDAAELFLARRRELNAGEREFVPMLRGEGLWLAADRLTFFGHWITPVGAPRRYDTRFFLASAPEGQEPLHDSFETIDHLWVRPAAALDRQRRGEFKMRTPTVHTLKCFADYDTVASLHAGISQGEVPVILPRITRDGRRLLPGDPGYDEAVGEQARGEWT
jgi:8-oxo-dGTP pyrophosphatase MutT (NUDIX family)